MKLQLANLGTVSRCLLLGLVLSVAVVIVLPIGFMLSGINGVWAGLAAVLVVWISSAIALCIGELFHGPNASLLKMLFGMTIRMALPLAACMFVQLNGGSLAAAGFVFYVLGFYLLALPIDTLLSVAGISHRVAV